MKGSNQDNYLPSIIQTYKYMEIAAVSALVYQIETERISG